MNLPIPDHVLVYQNFKLTLKLSKERLQINPTKRFVRRELPPIINGYSIRSQETHSIEPLTEKNISTIDRIRLYI